MRHWTLAHPLSRRRGNAVIAYLGGIALRIVPVFLLASCAGNPLVPAPMLTPPAAPNATVQATVPPNEYIVMLPACPHRGYFRAQCRSTPDQ